MVKRWALLIGLLALAEWRRPLRRPSRSRGPRWVRNLLLAAASGGVVAALETPLVQRVVARPQTPLRRWWAVLMLDYTLYWWHMGTHKIPFLWRFHAVHHRDEDMDWTTAVRFHCGEMLLSVPWRMVQVVVAGADGSSYQAWERLLLACILFQHSNLRLPERLERTLAMIIVTPRLHGRHHARRALERDCNWGSLLTVWDRLHGTFRWTAEAVPVGLADEFQAPFTGDPA